MKIYTTRFGEVDISEEKILTFIAPMKGFPEYSKYTIIKQKDDEMFHWLQSLEDPEIAFPITMTSYFGLDYSFEIDDATVEKLEIQKSEDVIIFNTVKIPHSAPKEATINLMGPVIVNDINKKALQYIIPNSSYSMRHPLFNNNELQQPE